MAKHWDTILFGVVLIGLVLPTDLLSAEPEDQVFFLAGAARVPDAEWEPGDLRILRGSIRQFDREQLILALPDGQTTSVDGDRVVRVVTQWRSEEARQAVGLADARKYREAIPALEQAIRSGIPRWQQRLLLARLVDCVQAIGKPRTAGILFLNLSATNPPALLYASMPLCWAVREPDPILLDKAREWIDSDDEVTRLLGASWLLFEPQSQQAEAVLLELESSAQRTVAQLAVAQRWRLTPPPTTMQELPGWMDFRDQLIEPLQLGPNEFLADRLLRINQPDLALGQLMRIVSLPSERYDRAAEALEAARKLLERQSKTPEAQRLQAWIEQSEKLEKP